MSSAQLPAGIETVLTDELASASAVVAAPVAEVFDYVRNVANHAAISGDGTVHDVVKAPELLGPDTSFSVKMSKGPIPYRMSSRVVEYGENRVIAWSHFGSHRWRWEFTSVDGGTRVTETYDQSTARAPWLLRRFGYPKAHLANVANSVANVRDHFAA